MNNNSTPQITTSKDFFDFFYLKTKWLNDYLIRISNQNDAHNSLFNDCVFDHFGYRCVDNQHYQTLIGDLLQSNKVKQIHRTSVNDREISIIKLQEKIPSYFGGLQYFEILDQKLDGSQVPGFDHAELVYKKNHLSRDFSKTKTYKVFENANLLSKEPKSRTGYVYSLYQIVLPGGFKILISQEDEFLWEIATRENPNGITILELG